MPIDDASIKRQIEFTPEFKRNVRHLSKKYRHIKSDLQPIIMDLESGKIPGDQIQSAGYTVYKVRVKNTVVSLLSVAMPLRLILTAESAEIAELRRGKS